MQGDLLLAATRIYSCSSQLQIQYHVARHTLFEAYCRELSQLRRKLGDEREHEVWRDFLRPHNRYRYEHAYAPIPFNIGAICEDETTALMSDRLEMIRRLFGVHFAKAKGLVERINTLRQHSYTPLQRAITNLIEADMDGTILVLRDRSIARLTASVLSATSLSGLPIFAASELSELDTHQQIVVIGNPRQYPEHLFMAPRAKQIHIIQYNFLFQKLVMEPALNGTRLSTSTSESGNADAGPRVLKLEDDSEREVFPASIDVSTDIGTLNAKIFEPDNDVDTGKGDIEAQLVLLQGGVGVLVDPSSSTLVIDPDDTDEYDMNLTRTRHLRPGMYLLVRTGTGGDYVRQVADLIMGQQADALRSCQKDWKSKLQEHINRKGTQQVCNELSELGAIRATPENLRNWVSPESIRTDDFRDFQAILALIGLTERAEQYWEAMCKIRHAHQVAGRKIRKQLLRQIQDTDLHTLETKGMMDFSLDDLEEIRMSAFRILQVRDTPIRVPISRLMRLIPLEVRSVG